MVSKIRLLAHYYYLDGDIKNAFLMSALLIGMEVNYYTSDKRYLGKIISNLPEVMMVHEDYCLALINAIKIMSYGEGDFYFSVEWIKSFYALIDNIVLVVRSDIDFCNVAKDVASFTKVFLSAEENLDNMIEGYLYMAIQGWGILPEGYDEYFKQHIHNWASHLKSDDHSK